MPDAMCQDLYCQVRISFIFLETNDPMTCPMEMSQNKQNRTPSLVLRLVWLLLISTKKSKNTKQRWMPFTVDTLSICS